MKNGYLSWCSSLSVSRGLVSTTVLPQDTITARLGYTSTVAAQTLRAPDSDDSLTLSSCRDVTFPPPSEESGLCSTSVRYDQHHS